MIHVTGTLRGMKTNPRIREATPSELFAERLEREAQRAFIANPQLAADYRRQAEMLRDMAAVHVSGRAPAPPRMSPGLR
jgi:hypothetical protein